MSKIGSHFKSLSIRSYIYRETVYISCGKRVTCIQITIAGNYHIQLISPGKSYFRSPTMYNIRAIPKYPSDIIFLSHMRILPIKIKCSILRKHVPIRHFRTSTSIGQTVRLPQLKIVTFPYISGYSFFSLRQIHNPIQTGLSLFLTQNHPPLAHGRSQADKEINFLL